MIGASAIGGRKGPVLRVDAAERQVDAKLQTQSVCAGRLRRAQAQRFFELGDRFDEAGLSRRQLGRADPERDGPIDVAGRLQVVCEDFWLRVYRSRGIGWTTRRKCARAARFFPYSAGWHRRRRAPARA